MLFHTADGENSEYEECRQAVYSLRHTGYPVIDKMPFQNDRPPLPFYRSGASGKNRVQARFRRRISHAPNLKCLCTKISP